jgi:hypothetical protein
MPPEQLRGDRVDARADQYAFCASLHEALAGAPPDEGGDVRAIPRRLRPILARGLADEPDHRFASIRALVAELADARRGRARRCAGAMAGIVRSSSL